MIAGLLTALYSFYNALFQPILSLGPYIALGFFSATLAALFSGIRYMLLDHEQAEKIQDKINEKQEKMKEARENENHEKASEHTKDVFKHNQEFMMLNMKPMIGTMLFVALIFPWLGATFAPSVQLQTVDNTTFQGNFTYAQNQTPITIQNTSETTTLQINNQEIQSGEPANINGFEWTFKGIKQITPGLFNDYDGTTANFNGKFIPLPITLPWIGPALNWLGYYIVIAMPMTLILNRVLGIQ